jgi:hypothetical protein
LRVRDLFARLKQRTVALERLLSYQLAARKHCARHGGRAEGATVTTRYERLKMQRRMQRRIRLVVEERRMAFGPRPETRGEVPADPEATMEIEPMTLRAIGRVAVRPAL